jgi:hypothetical protein
MSGLQSSQPLEPIPRDLSQVSRGGDTNYTQPNDQSNKTDRGTYESGRSRASDSLADGATSASEGTQYDVQEGEAHSPDMIGLLKEQCPKHYRGDDNQRRGWDDLADQIGKMCRMFSARTKKARGEDVYRHYEAQKNFFGEKSPVNVGCNRMPYNWHLVSIFLCLDGPEGDAATRLTLEKQESSQKAFDYKALEGLPRAGGRDRHTVRAVMNTAWFESHPRYTTTVVTEDGNAGWMVTNQGLAATFGRIDSDSHLISVYFSITVVDFQVRRELRKSLKREHTFLDQDISRIRAGNSADFSKRAFTDILTGMRRSRTTSTRICETAGGTAAWRRTFARFGDETDGKYEFYGLIDSSHQ